MTDVVLTAAEQARLASAIAMVFAAGTVGDDERWGREVAAGLNALVDADAAILVLQRDGAARFYGDPLPAPIVRRFVTAPAELAGPGEAPGARVWCRAAAPADAIVVNDHAAGAGVVPEGEYEAVGFTTEFGIPGTYARAACHLQPPRDSADTQRRLALLALVLPAVAAAARARAFAAGPHDAMVKLVDALDTGVLLSTARGRVIHVNAALTRMFNAPADGPALRAAVMRACAAFALGDGAAPGEHTVTRDLRVAGGRYAIRSSLLTADAPGLAATVAVTVERVGGPAPAVAGLRERFGLTEREVDVTRLLAAGKSNAAIALALRISPSTARHHTERVLEKLGASSRAGVSAIVHGAPDPA